MRDLVQVNDPSDPRLRRLTDTERKQANTPALRAMSTEAQLKYFRANRRAGRFVTKYVGGFRVTLIFIAGIGGIAVGIGMPLAAVQRLMIIGLGAVACGIATLLARILKKRLEIIGLPEDLD